MIAAKQRERGKTEHNDRLLGVAVHSYQHEDVPSIEQMGKTLLSQVEAFFVSYNRQRGKEFTVTATSGPTQAIRLLKAGIRAYKEEHES